MKKVLVSFLLILGLLTFAEPANALLPLRKEIKETIENTVEQGKNEGLSPSAIRQEVKENIRNEFQERKQNLFNRAKDLIKKKLRFNARIQGEITTKTDSSLTVKTEDGKVYTVNTTGAKLVRRFGGKSDLSEFSMGNKVNVFGKFTDAEQTTIDARLIRNISIQKRWGTFFGEVTSKTSTDFKMKSIQRGEQTVSVGSDTKIVNRKEGSITYDQVQVGHKVRVKGMWDRSLNTITEVKQIKDFSLPIIVAPTP